MFYHNKNNVYYDPLKSFTDREQIIDHIDQFLSSTQPGIFRCFAIKGNSGSGKTFLIAFLLQRLLTNQTWRADTINFTKSNTANFRSLLNELESALKQCVPPLSISRYRLKRDNLYQRFEEYRASITMNQTISATNASSITEVSMNVQVTTELQQRETQLRADLTTALLESTEDSEYPLCLFLDNYEYLVEASEEILEWFGETLTKLSKASKHTIRFIICGWRWPSNAGITPFIYNTFLDDFAKEQIEIYLHKQGLLTQVPTTQKPELIAAFYELTRGHPLVLGLAATYFKYLDEQERNAQNLFQQKPLIDEQARIEFLEDRLLKRLPEPHRTLLERGPILRHIEQETFQVLLNLPLESGDQQIKALDDRAYSYFLGYPFVYQAKEMTLQHEQVVYHFHKLVRQVRLTALRLHHPQTKERLHSRMLEYYQQLETLLLARNNSEKIRNNVITDEHCILLAERFYHALQIQHLREQAFHDWCTVTQYTLTNWNHQHTHILLNVIQQLEEDGESFFQKDTLYYGDYLIQDADLHFQELHWKKSKSQLELAADIFKHKNASKKLAQTWLELGKISQQEGEWNEARAYYEQALALQSRENDIEAFCAACNGLAVIAIAQGHLTEALNYFKQIINLAEQGYDTGDLTTIIHNIGMVHRESGQLDLALDYFKQALKRREQDGTPSEIAQSLNVIGGVYDALGKKDEALDYYKRGLEIRETVGNPIDIAISLNNIGLIYKEQEQYEQSLQYYERALALRERIGNPLDLGDSYNNMAHLLLARLGVERQSRNIQPPLLSREELHPITILFEKALLLYKTLGPGFEWKVALTLEMFAFCSILAGDMHKALVYAKQAKTVRENTLQTNERVSFDDNISPLFKYALYPLLERLEKEPGPHKFRGNQQPVRGKKHRNQKRKGR